MFSYIPIYVYINTSIGNELGTMPTYWFIFCGIMVNDLHLFMSCWIQNAPNWKILFKKQFEGSNDRQRIDLIILFAKVCSFRLNKTKNNEFENKYSSRVINVYRFDGKCYLVLLINYINHGVPSISNLITNFFLCSIQHIYTYVIFVSKSLVKQQDINYQYK